MFVYQKEVESIVIGCLRKNGYEDSGIIIFPELTLEFGIKMNIEDRVKIIAQLDGVFGVETDIETIQEFETVSNVVTYYLQCLEGEESTTVENPVLGTMTYNNNGTQCFRMFGVDIVRNEG